MLREFLISWIAAGVVYAALLALAGFVMFKLGWLDPKEAADDNRNLGGTSSGRPAA
ncbi:hypothetical protein [Roseateles sp.]|uniref:hypothetical protein n=1 Tax=Roseateles sp. TaxID=1971397 RepID=UPI002F3F4A8B